MDKITRVNRQKFHRFVKSSMGHGFQEANQLINLFFFSKKSILTFFKQNFVIAAYHCTHVLKILSVYSDHLFYF